MKIPISASLADLPKVDIYELSPLQGNLKILTASSYLSLKKALLNGFIVPLYIWIDDNNKKWYIDGHQRDIIFKKEKALFAQLNDLQFDVFSKKKLTEKHDYIESLPVDFNTMLPYVQVTAISKKDAVNKLLQITSNYGRVTFAGVKKLIIDHKLKSDDFNTYSLPEVPNLKSRLAIALIEEKEPDEKKASKNLKIETITKEGDVYEFIANGLLHRLVCGDSLKESDYSKLMQGEKAAMCWADSPYNKSIKEISSSRYHYESVGKIHEDFAMAFGEMSQDEFIDFLTKIYKQMAANSTNGSIHYIKIDWTNQYNCLQAGYEVFSELKHIAFWNKDVKSQGSFYCNSHEIINIFKNGTNKHINNMLQGMAGRVRSNVWSYPHINSFASGKQRKYMKLHPTVCPYELILDVIYDCSHEGNIILDPFGGSGTSLISCIIAGRCARLMELYPPYCDAVVWRLIEHCKDHEIEFEIKRNGKKQTKKDVQRYWKNYEHILNSFN